jgi:uncharacterized protein (DUF2062 family)
VKDFFRRRLVQPLLAQLKQGVSPDELALSCALGAALGVFPILGVTTLLCLAAGVFLKLNQPAIQTVNYFVYPLQFALLPVFVRLGETAFGAPHVPLAPQKLIGEFFADPRLFLVNYGAAGAYGTAAWACLALPAAWAARKVLSRTFAKLSRAYKNATMTSGR